jgi:hypothetical protein
VSLLISRHKALIFCHDLYSLVKVLELRNTDSNETENDISTSELSINFYCSEDNENSLSLSLSLSLSYIYIYILFNVDVGKGEKENYTKIKNKGDIAFIKAVGHGSNK